MHRQLLGACVNSLLKLSGEEDKLSIGFDETEGDLLLHLFQSA